MRLNVWTDKESWRSVIEEIFRNQREKDSKLRIREAYAFDRQNHSESAILNKEYLAGLKGCTRTLRVTPSVESLAELVSLSAIGLWGEAVRAFVQTRLKARRIVAIGHSGGTACMCVYLPTPTLSHQATNMYAQRIVNTRPPRQRYTLPLLDLHRAHAAHEQPMAPNLRPTQGTE